MVVLLIRAPHSKGLEPLENPAQFVTLIASRD